MKAYEATVDASLDKQALDLSAELAAERAPRFAQDQLAYQTAEATAMQPELTSETEPIYALQGDLWNRLATSVSNKLHIREFIDQRLMPNRRKYAATALTVFAVASCSGADKVTTTPKSTSSSSESTAGRLSGRPCAGS